MDVQIASPQVFDPTQLAQFNRQLTELDQDLVDRIVELVTVADVVRGREAVVQAINDDMRWQSFTVGIAFDLLWMTGRLVKATVRSTTASVDGLEVFATPDRIGDLVGHAPAAVG